MAISNPPKDKVTNKGKTVDIKFRECVILIVWVNAMFWGQDALITVDM